MATNPFGSLLRSRKFWLLVLDLIVSLVLYFTAKYAGESAAADIKLVIGLIQPVIIAVIISIAVEDVAGIKAGARPPQAK